MATEVRERGLSSAPRWLSLAPGRERSRTPAELAAPGSPLRASLLRISEAIAEHHPDNLFGDLDALATALAQLDDGAREERAERIVGLHQLFGQKSPIRFRYVHDFLYGFDWARWVARAPEERRSVRPYDEAFLGYLEQRGRELLSLIARDDAKYPTLRDRGSRNPFPFSREPDAEIAIHRALAARGMVPLAAWESDPVPRWDRSCSAVREAVARELGHALPATGAGTLHASLRKGR